MNDKLSRNSPVESSTYGNATFRRNISSSEHYDVNLESRWFQSEGFLLIFKASILGKWSGYRLVYLYYLKEYNGGVAYGFREMPKVHSNIFAKMIFHLFPNSSYLNVVNIHIHYSRLTTDYHSVFKKLVRRYSLLLFPLFKKSLWSYQRANPINTSSFPSGDFFPTSERVRVCFIEQLHSDLDIIISAISA